jgi:hypothetical protein
MAWPAKEISALPQKSLAQLGRANLAVVDASAEYTDFVEQLTEYPNECWPEIGIEMIEALEAEQATVPHTDLYLALNIPGERQPLIWRWDNQKTRLSRILRP